MTFNTVEQLSLKRMPPGRPANGWALVLGPGGPVGTAWLTGLAAGLREAGVEPADADLIVGTSAGAIVGAMLATGRDLAAVAELPPRDGPQGTVDTTLVATVFELLGDTSLEPDEARRRVGRLALASGALTAERHLARMRFLVGTDEWPVKPLLITAVDVESGKPVIWDRSSRVPLATAVASSSAAPGSTRPIPIGGRPYMDGAFGGGSEAALAGNAGTTVVIEPLAHRFGGSDADVRIVPDPPALEAFGDDLGDLSRWTPVYQAGHRQAPGAAIQIAAALG